MNLNVVLAIFRRNFFSYFANPTGYVFICLFVLLGSIAAFWPNEFFNANLANLDQLNRWFPYIMLVFIPAITMSIWAEERRQGTDELLLTIPAADFDVVAGKYLAAVAIFTSALVFSALCNYSVLGYLGAPDMGLFFSTYVGYWFVGLAMLAIGMVASFLTGNLTVGFVLGVLFNAPLVFAGAADTIMRPDWAMAVRGWSLEEQLRDFTRGVISLSGVAYFLFIVAVMLYLSMVLIGRRHWMGGRDGSSLGGHYLLRALALVVVALGAVVLCTRLPARADVTSERLSSLSPKTREVLAKLDAKQPVVVDAYVSPDVPEAFVQTRLNMLTLLREFAALSRGNVRLNIHNTERLSQEADSAEQQFGITGQKVLSRRRGVLSQEEIYLGAAFTSGLNKVVVPFFDRGIPAEYEIIRSIATVTQQERKKLGVLMTDAKLFGGFDQATFSPTQNQAIIDELQKQYEVIQVNADSPIADDLDVLLAVQPSSLNPDQMKNFVAAVRAGIPTAVFEDPLPLFDRKIPGTSAPKQPQQSMFSMGQPPMPKGNIKELWDLLGVEFTGNKVVWQEYNPYPKQAETFDNIPEFVFTDQTIGSFNPRNPISKSMEQVLFCFPGAITKLNASSLEFEPLSTTGDVTGTVDTSRIFAPSMFGQGGNIDPRRPHTPTREQYTLAAAIHGKAAKTENQKRAADDPPAKPTATAPNADDQAAAAAAAHKAAGVHVDADKTTKSDAKAKAADKKETKKPKERSGINVVLVSDVDILYDVFFALRNIAEDPEGEMKVKVDNISFVLNALDVLAGDERFVDIRTRRPKHRTLTTIESRTKHAQEKATELVKEFDTKLQESKEKEQKAFDEQIKKLQERKDLDQTTAMTELAMAKDAGERRLSTRVEQLSHQRDLDVEGIDRNLSLEIRKVQDQYKMYAVLIPPILPLLVGLGVFFNRRRREREGVSRERLR